MSPHQNRKQTTLRGAVAMLVAASMIALPASVATPAFAAASTSADSASKEVAEKGFWIDCPEGAKYCTKYWSRSKTLDLFDNTQELTWPIARLAAEAQVWYAVLFYQGTRSVNQMEDAIDEAAFDDACVQQRTRQDGRPGVVWSSTNHPDYCFD